MSGTILHTSMHQTSVGGDEQSDRSYSTYQLKILNTNILTSNAIIDFPEVMPLQYLITDGS